MARKSRKTAARNVVIYASLFALIISFLTVTNQQYNDAAAGAGAEVAQLRTDSVNLPSAPEMVSVDQLTAANAVTNLAEATNLPAAGDLREATTTLEIQKQLAQDDVEVISKPQLVQPETSAKRGISEHIAKQGEDIANIASQYGISPQTLRWANNTNSDAVEPGRTLLIPRVDGVVYSVKEGDTVAALASKYKADAERIVLYNDLDEGAPLKAGVRLVLPGGELPENERPGYVAPRSRGRQGARSGGAATTVSHRYVFASVGNRYAPGNCTWYSYERRLALGRPIGSFWGDARLWASSARAAGFTVNNTPAPGAIFQTSRGGGGYGHVGIVERVDAAGVHVSDMNYAGYGVVTNRTFSHAEAALYNYIH